MQPGLADLLLDDVELEGEGKVAVGTQNTEGTHLPRNR